MLLVGLAPLANRFAFALPACPIKAVVGLPCLSCGTTRAGLALSRLDLVSAFSINPLAALTWVVLVGGGLTAGALALGGKSIKEPDWNLSLPRRWLLVAVLLTNWVYLVGAGI